MSSLNLVYASVPMGSRGLQILFCFIRLFVSPFGLPFLKLSLPFLRFKELLNSGQQRSRKRVDLIVRYPRIVFFLLDIQPINSLLLLFYCQAACSLVIPYPFLPPVLYSFRRSLEEVGFRLACSQKCDLLHFY